MKSVTNRARWAKKNLIAYFSNLLWRFSAALSGTPNRGCTPDNGQTLDRHWFEIGSCKLITLLCLLFSLGVGNMWGYTGTFTNYTNATLIDGYYVIGASTTASNNSYCAGTAVSSGRITGKSLVTSNPGNNIVWIIEETASGWTFNNYGTSTKYIRQNGTTSGGGMQVNTTIGYFTLAGYNSSSPVGFRFTSADKNSNNFLKYNNSSKWFSNYANAYTTSMTPVCLYRDNTKYRAKTTQPATGSFVASATSATWDATKKHLSWMASGATVTLTATPPSGKAVNAWTVTKATGGTVTVTSTGTNTATFSMPADQVTVTVTWKDAGTSVSLTKAGQTNGSFLLIIILICRSLNKNLHETVETLETLCCNLPTILIRISFASCTSVYDSNNP